METITVKSTATNSELLKLVQSLTIDKVDFDSLSRDTSNDVLYVVNQAYRTIALEVESLRYRLSKLDGLEAKGLENPQWTKETADDMRRWIKAGKFDFSLNLNFGGKHSPANFGEYMVRIEE